jgi:uncharacterized protein YybS (DUF2232 family)
MRAVLYIEVLLGTLLGTGICARFGLDPIAMALIPVPVALYWATGSPGRSLAVVACAVLGAWAGAGALAAAAIYNLAAVAGVLLGWAMKRRWTFGWCVTLATTAVYAIVVLALWVNWDTSIIHLNHVVDTLTVQMEKSAVQDNREMTQVYIETMHFVQENWTYLVLGLIFNFMLLGVVLLVASLALMLRLLGADEGPSTGFRAMRAPEMLVWLVIGLAVLWFIDHRWPNDAIRFVAWNGALGLQCVYMLGGFAILLYTLKAFKVNRLMAAMMITFLLVFMQGLSAPMCMLGLFDTWWDFRKKVDRVIEARQARES